MTESTNAAQVEYWNGAAATRWVTQQEALDRALQPFGDALFRRASLKSNERVVDIGCGCGVTSVAASDAVGPAGSVLGVDVSAPMLDRAKERSGVRTNVSFALADATTHRFGPPVDVVLSRFGVMFFEDPVAAFANIRAALGPGGRLAFVAWRSVPENPWVTIPRDAALLHARPVPRSGPEDPGPFSFGDRARIERILSAAGFSNVAIAPFDADVVMSETGLDQAVAFAITAGPTARMLVDVTSDVKVRVEGAVRDALAPLAREGRVALRGATWIVGSGV
jgi:SAM-dependent methyltransferase